MNLNKTCVLLFILMSFVAICSAQTPVEQKPAVVAPKTDEVVKPSLKRNSSGQILFPDVAGWEREDPRVYPGEGAGYSVNYDTPQTRVTVYEYNAGRSKIPNELGSAVEQEVDGAAQAIVGAGEAGIYSDVKRTKTETITLGGEKGSVKVRYSAFTLKREGRKMNSYIILFPYKDHFIKLRVTRAATADKADDEAYAKLLWELDQLFSN
jgi:hypothetical protein